MHKEDFILYLYASLDYALILMFLIFMLIFATSLKRIIFHKNAFTLAQLTSQIWFGKEPNLDSLSLHELEELKQSNEAILSRAMRLCILSLCLCTLYFVDRIFDIYSSGYLSVLRGTISDDILLSLVNIQILVLVIYLSKNQSINYYISSAVTMKNESQKVIIS